MIYYFTPPSPIWYFAIFLSDPPSAKSLMWLMDAPLFSLKCGKHLNGCSCLYLIISYKSLSIWSMNSTNFRCWNFSKSSIQLLTSAHETETGNHLLIITKTSDVWPTETKTVERITPSMVRWRESFDNKTFRMIQSLRKFRVSRSCRGTRNNIGN